MNSFNLFNNIRKQNKIITGLIFFSCFFYFFIGNSLNLSINSVGIRLTEVLLFAVAMIAFIYILCVKNEVNQTSINKFKKNPIRFLIIWIIFSSLISLFLTIGGTYTFDSFFEGILYPIRLLLYIFVILTFKYYFNIAKIKNSTIENIVIFAFALTCLVGVFQYFVYPIARDFYALFLKIGVNWYYTSDPHINRLVGLYFDPNYFSSILIIPTTLVFKNLINNKHKSAKISNLLLFLLFVITILLTKSRSGFLGLVIILPLLIIYYGKSKKNYFLLLLLICLIPIALLVLPFLNISVVNRILAGVSDWSSQARFWKWQIGFEAFSKYPIFGIGFNMSKAYYSTIGLSIVGTGNDSSLIQVLMCSGSIGFILFLMYLIELFKNKNVAAEYKIVYIAGLIICNFNELLFNPLWFFPVTLLIANGFDYSKKTIKESTYNKALLSILQES